jgi:hypothetical protein
MEASHRRSSSKSSASTSRFEFVVDGTLIYEWEQTIDEVVIYIPNAPRPAPSCALKVVINPSRLRVGIVNAAASGSSQELSYFIDEDTFGKVDVAESTWLREDDNVLAIYLQKANKGVVWERALTRFDARLGPIQLEQVRQEMMRERWSRENPGMDFSSAEFNGQAPDPRTFMGGCSYE